MKYLLALILWSLINFPVFIYGELWGFNFFYMNSVYFGVTFLIIIFGFFEARHEEKMREIEPIYYSVERAEVINNFGEAGLV